MHIASAPYAHSKTWTAGTISFEELASWLDEPALTKECGGYLLGQLAGGRRSKRTVLARDAITLDADSARSDLPELVEMLGYQAIAHTTFRSTPTDPRYRLIFPTDRPMSAREYAVAATALMSLLGADQFDPGSAQAERFMFRPSTQAPEYWHSLVVEGDPVSVDALLAESGEEVDYTGATPPQGSRKRDPLELPGTIGAFNRCYTIGDAIERFELPYTPVSEGIWKLVGAKSTAGLHEIAPGLAFSHHATDPAFNQTCSAFDLVRLHKFGELDAFAEPKTPVSRLPSTEKMLEEAIAIPEVLNEATGADFEAELYNDPDAYKNHLVRDKRTGAMKDVWQNWELLRRYFFPSVRYNERTLNVEIDGNPLDLPWRGERHSSTSWNDADLYGLCHTIEADFGLRPSRPFVSELILTAAQKHRYDPVRDWLLTLQWDGLPRVEMCLPGVEDTPYNRLVARKTMVAAVARAFDPGVKWDHITIFYGGEGLGKTHWIDTMARGWSAPLGRIGDKDTLLTMRRSWITVADEGVSLKKADSDALKSFITTREDVFREPYGIEVQAHPRGNVFWGTTNDPVFLRAQAGNRRFLVVHSKNSLDFDALTDDYVSQVWAEAVMMYQAGEQLYLNETESELVTYGRARYVEESALMGLIVEWLETPVPEGYLSWSVPDRCLWRAENASGVADRPGEMLLESVCTAQLWAEMLERKPGTASRVDLLELSNALSELGWRVAPKPRRFRHYGPQRAFTRPANETLI